MNEELFEELLESVKKGGETLRGRRKPSQGVSGGEPDVRAVREGCRLSQSKFAALMGISAGTLRDWEQGRRKPECNGRILSEDCGKTPRGSVRCRSYGAASRRRA
jgi:putative transcriptional regulator